MKMVLIMLLVLIIVPLESCVEKPISVEFISSVYELNSPANHGLNKLNEALKDQQILIAPQAESDDGNSDYYILAGLSSEENHVTTLLREMQIPLPEKKEALLIKKADFRGKPALLLCGADQTGLMYATLDVANRISWSKDPKKLFEYVVDASESPDVQERGVSAGTFQRRYFEEKLHDLNYWEKYFDMMAENRLNQFLLIFGYKNNQYREPNFTAPAYPNFFNLEEYPHVRMSNISEEQQGENREALKKIINLAHARGIEFGVGLWDQIERDKRYLSMVRDDTDVPADLPPNIIWGLSQENLIPYTKLAMRKFFQTFPEIDLVQFRMHWESGITGEVALQFWKEIFNILKEECPDIKVEARAKDVPDETLYDGSATGMDFRVATKHWMEQMGQPFHPTHINKPNQLDRRHGYADLLRYPKRYGFKWRVWSGGTTRVFLWGDPEWVKLFSEGSHLYDAVGFEFNEPLYFKMNGSLHDAEVSELLNPENRYYTYEFERYWHYYQVMGRISYNPDTPAEVWEMEFSSRFGKEAGPWLMDGLHQASKVLPRIVSASYLYSRFPSPQGWPELQRLGDLKHFALNSKPSDIQLFASPMEEAESILRGEFSVRLQASQISDWFSKTSKRILSDVEEAEGSIGNYPSKEYFSTITDLKMLAYLSKYHSQRLLAAVQYNLYDKTGDLVSFDKAIEFESQAVAAYGSLVEAAGNIYNMHLDFGSNEELFPGHWNKEYQRLQEELEELRETRAAAIINEKQDGLLAHVPVQRVMLKDPIVISGTLLADGSIQSTRLMFATEGKDFSPIELKIAREGIFSAEIPAQKSEGSIKYYLEITETSGKKVYFPASGPLSPIEVFVSNDREAPLVDLERFASAKLNVDLKVSAHVKDSSGIQNVVLRYRRVSQFEDYESESMAYNASTGKYEARIPAQFFDGKYDLMYFIEAMDTKGNGRMYPDLEIETPYLIVHLDRQGI
ncbi:MAG: hypothetical protein QNK35_00805 [Bacteroides sp.]|nr:hypothetical protein [Bacteroides sp.]